MRSAVALAPLVVLTAAVTGVALYELSRPAPPPPRKVKLAVLVVFDQLRGDYLTRWQRLLRDDGFVRIQRDGAWFSNCHYPYAVTTTGPGHASLLTGTTPDRHGIVNNEWFENGKQVYCAGAEQYRLVPPPSDTPPSPSEKSFAKPKKAELVGSPERLLSETVADVLKTATGGRSKVFGLSLKDRSAILPTGKRPDGAYWFYAVSRRRPDGTDAVDGVFGTSTYYTEKVNDTGRVHPWVAEFNASRRATQWFGRYWTRFRPDNLSDYNELAGPDDVRGEGSGVGQGVTFPHPTTGGKTKLGKSYFEALANSPFGNDLLLEFTKTCITAEGLGTRDVPDLLVVSFSSNDLIGHTWGPDSHEVLDVTLRSDALMADLLGFLDRTVGRDQYLLGVTADHGVCPLPEVSRAKGSAPWAGRFDPSAVEKELDEHLTKVFSTVKSADGKSARWVDAFSGPWVYLNPALVKASGQPREAIAAEAAKFLDGRVGALPADSHRRGVERTFTRAELSGPGSEADPITARVKRSFYPARCGDVYVLLRRYWIESKTPTDPTQLPTGTTHGTPYDYDTHVPLLVYGPGIHGGERDEPTTPQALASIFAKWLGVSRPKDATYPLPVSLE
jgi:hypothetical protein